MVINNIKYLFRGQTGHFLSSARSMFYLYFQRVRAENCDYGISQRIYIIDSHFIRKKKRVEREY